jgi:uncharacterized membrane protein
MRNKSLLSLIFAVLSVVFFLVLIFFRTPFTLYPLMSNQDALDLLTPLVLIPIYWLMFRQTSREGSGLSEEVIFLLLAVFWVSGQGMHLAANSVGNLIEALARDRVLDIKPTDIYNLTYFLDEHLSHFIWHIGIIGLAVLLIYRDWRRPADTTTRWWSTILAGLLYGFMLFCIFLEGQTVILGFPCCILISLVVLIWGRMQLAHKPILAFFFIAFLVATLFLVGWRLYWGGFPQFSDVGLI